jgi:hypothetical protein
MNPADPKRDLIILVADRNMEAFVTGILKRPKSLNIQPVTFDIRRHPEQDSGCRTGGVEFLSPFKNQYRHAILMFDREGSGAKIKSTEVIELELEKALEDEWGTRGAVIVIDPELENWVWSNSPQVEQVLGWSGRVPPLQVWLKQKDFLQPKAVKPPRPKEALEKALWLVRKPRSSAIYQLLAERVSLSQCTDRAFGKFKGIMERWFSETN